MGARLRPARRQITAVAVGAFALAALTLYFGFGAAMVCGLGCQPGEPSTETVLRNAGVIAATFVLVAITLLFLRPHEEAAPDPPRSRGVATMILGLGLFALAPLAVWWAWFEGTFDTSPGYPDAPLITIVGSVGAFVLIVAGAFLTVRGRPDR